ncbi:unnamed protein product, partial [Rotaria sp. Silwood2]
LVKDVVKFEMLLAAGAIEDWTYYLINFTPLSTSLHPLSPLIRSKNEEEDKSLNKECIRFESDLKRIYINATRSIQTQDQTNSNRYALVKANAFKETNIKRPEECRCVLQDFQYFIKEFQDKIDTSELEIKDLAMETRGYGIFANVKGEDSFEEYVKFIFVGLIQRCEQIAMPTMTLSQTVDVFNERFYDLPNLIDVLSAIIIEMTNIGKEFLGPLERLTYMTIDYYPRYQPKPQATTCSSVIKMILEEDEDETTTTDSGFGMKPGKPKDFQIF